MWTRVPRSLVRIGAVVAAVVVLVPSAQALEARSSDTRAIPGDEVVEETPALYNGEIIDLADDWEGASACLVIDRLAYPECFDTDEERLERLDELGLRDVFADAAPTGGLTFAAASCSSYLKLYDGYNYGGASLWLSTRGLWLNLSSYGFNQRASSYRVGGCSSYMADYNWGGGAWIPTSATQAWDVDAVISGSWNNDISSVYIL